MNKIKFLLCFFYNRDNANNRGMAFFYYFSFECNVSTSEKAKIIVPVSFGQHRIGHTDSSEILNLIQVCLQISRLDNHQPLFINAHYDWENSLSNNNNKNSYLLYRIAREYLDHSHSSNEIISNKLNNFFSLK